MLYYIKKRLRAFILSVLLLLATIPASVSASPFGQGVFGADVPFGSATSLTIALGGNVGLSLTQNGGNFEGAGSHTLTVTTTDVEGYRLYIYAPGSTSMTNGADTITASSNVSAGALTANTWGYNTSGSTTNFIGVKNVPVLLKDASGPYKSGDNTTITYGVKVSATKGAGNYSSAVVYTAVCKSQ